MEKPSRNRRSWIGVGTLRALTASVYVARLGKLDRLKGCIVEMSSRTRSGLTAKYKRRGALNLRVTTWNSAPVDILTICRPGGIRKRSLNPASGNRFNIRILY